MITEYKTLACESSFELIEKKSRFIAYAAPCMTQEEADGFVAKVKAMHPDARHHVFAYAVGGLDSNSEIRRMSDDGEPQGTGGVPCLDAISKKGLRCAAIVVVRYFGGILLGAPGLVRAYGKTAVGAADAAGECIMHSCRSVTVTTDYQLYGKLSRAAESSGFTVEPPVFGENVSFSLIIPNENAESYATYLRDLSNARATVEVSSELRFMKKK